MKGRFNPLASRSAWQVPFGIFFLFAIPAFVLTLLCLLAGYQVRFLEDKYILHLNTTGLGTALLSSRSTIVGATGSEGSVYLETRQGSIVDSFKDKVGDTFDDVKDKLKDIPKTVGAKITEELGISEYYNLHATTLCQGRFTADGGFNASECHRPDDFNPFAEIDRELSIGPYKLNAASLGIAQDMQDQVNKFKGTLKALIGVYATALAGNGLGLVASAASVFVFAGESAVRHRNFALAGAASFALPFSILLVATALLEKYLHDFVGEIQNAASAIGLGVKVGRSFLIMSWAAWALSTICFFYFIYEVVRARRQYGPGHGRRFAGRFASRNHHHKDVRESSDLPVTEKRYRGA